MYGTVSKAQVRRFSALQALYWAYVGSFHSFLLSMLAARGESATMIGVYTALMTLGSCLGQFFVARLCDATGRCRRVFVQVVLALELSCLLLYSVTERWLILILIFAAGFAKQPLGAVLDTWFIRAVGDDMRAFGRMRAAGSLAFALLMLVYGAALNRFGYGIMPWVSAVLLCWLVALCLRTKDTSRAPAAGERPRLLSGLSLITGELILIFAALFFLGAANNSVYNMIPVLLPVLGGTTAHHGLLLFCNAGMEAPAMRVNWDRFGLSPAKRCVLSALLYAVSTLLMGLAGNVWLFIALWCVNGFAFGLGLHARRALVTALAPDEAQTTMHGLGDMMYSGVGPILASVVFGGMLDQGGMRLMLSVAAGLELVSAALFAVLVWRKRKMMNTAS